MNHSDEAPKLNPWPFIVGDVVLLGTAAVIASRSAGPLEGSALIVVACCVCVGAVLACIPFILSYTRQQDLALTERQHEIAALARTTAASAEQLGIATTGLNTIAENVARTLKHADQLPAKLQEKINAFKTQLNEVAVTENEALAQEVNTLRSSEIERFESAFAAVRKTAGELTQLDASIRRQLADFDQSLARVSSSSERAATDINAAITSIRGETERALREALSAFEARVASLPVAASPIAAGLEPADDGEKLPTIGSAAPLDVQRESATRSPSVAANPLRGANVAADAASAPPTSSSLPSRPPLPETNPPFPMPDIAPAADSTPATPRKRVARKTHATDDAQPSLGLELADSPENTEYSQLSPDETERSSAVSADGVTRLLVTAYIGIGNKLFVRGDGPGLSWENGVPMQFVSIGKWRWDTDAATETVTLKLYKNDEVECTAIGAITLEPGHQQEVRASF